MSNVLIIPAEGDFPQTEHCYASAMRSHYAGEHINLQILKIFPDVQMDRAIDHAFARVQHDHLEIHAHAGFGAYVAWRFLQQYPDRVDCVFFIGGAPGSCMTPLAKPFHLQVASALRLLHIPLFADDPNWAGDPRVEIIRSSSTKYMREYPEFYDDQLKVCARWEIPSTWHNPSSCDSWFIPNGRPRRQAWRHETFNNTKAAQLWERHGVAAAPRPGGNFSFYSLMPAEELFTVMDAIRATA